MNAFEVAATALLLGYVPLGIVAVRSRPIDGLVRAQLRKTEWNTGAREKDLAHLGGLDG